MSVNMSAHKQWSSRTADECFESLEAIREHTNYIAENSKRVVVPLDSLRIEAEDNDLRVYCDHGKGSKVGLHLTHTSLGQIAGKSATISPTAVSRLPVAMSADTLTWGLRNAGRLAASEAQEAADGVLMLAAPDDADIWEGLSTASRRSVASEALSEDVQLYIQRVPENEHEHKYVLNAVTGHSYGLVLNRDVIDGLISVLGDGRNGDFRPPMEKGRGPGHGSKEVTKADAKLGRKTTLYAGEQDIWCFLANEKKRFNIPQFRADCKDDRGLAPCITAFNSESGFGNLGVEFGFFDSMCRNHMLWGFNSAIKLEMKHTSKAPKVWRETIMPALEAFVRLASNEDVMSGVTLAHKQAQAIRFDDQIDANRFIGHHFGAPRIKPMRQIFQASEGREIGNILDAVNAATAYARAIPYRNRRALVERKAGEILRKVASDADKANPAITYVVGDAA